MEPRLVRLALRMRSEPTSWNVHSHAAQWVARLFGHLQKPNSIEYSLATSKTRISLAQFNADVFYQISKMENE